MKRSSKVYGFIAAAAITALAAAPLLAGMGGGMTTADLALQLAQAAGLSLPASGSPQSALESLGKAGIRVEGDLNAPVTENVLAQVGLKVSTSRPEAAVSPAVGSIFLQLFRGALQSAAAGSVQSGTDIVHASCQGRASRAARKGTRASPADFNATAWPCEEPAFSP